MTTFVEQKIREAEALLREIDDCLAVYAQVMMDTRLPETERRTAQISHQQLAMERAEAIGRLEALQHELLRKGSVGTSLH
jgi:uncharacterized protein (UPF0147 family)